MISELLDGITLDGKPVETLYPGWLPVSRHHVTGPFEVLVFQENATGRKACWWIEDGLFSASHVLALAPDTQHRLLTAMDPVFWPLAEGVLTGQPRDDATQFRTDLPDQALQELSGVWLGRHAPHAIFIAAGHADSGEALTCPDGKPIAEGRIKALLAATQGSDALVVPSPFSGLPVRAQLDMNLGPARAYRFYDMTEQTVFYLIWNSIAPEHRPAFYYPAGPLLISESPSGPFYPGWILEWYARTPDHADKIERARPFLPEDFGVGQASSLRKPVQKTPAVPEDTQSPVSKAFPSLPQLSEQPPSPVLKAPEKKGLLGTLRSILRKNH